MENKSGYEAGSEKSSSPPGVSDSGSLSPDSESLSPSDESVPDSPVKPEEKKKPCEICGSDADQLKIMTCVNCKETREHIYCAKEKLQRVPLMWMCEACHTPSPNLNRGNKTTSSRMDTEDSVDQEKKKKPCEICGSDADQLKIMTCVKCRETREHIYCATVKLKSVPYMWLCEVCRNPSSIPDPVDQTAPLSQSNQVVESETSVPPVVRDVHITFQAKNLLQKKNLESE